MWAVNVDEAADTDAVSTVYAFRLDTKQRDPSNDIDLLGTPGHLVRRPLGLAGSLDSSGTADRVFVTRGQATHPSVQWFVEGTDGNWVATRSGNIFFAGVNLAAELTRGIWFDGRETLWLAHKSTPHRIHVFTVNSIGSATEVVGGHITLDSTNTDPKGIWSDGETMWVVNLGHIYAYDMAAKTRVEAKEFTSSHLTVKGTAVSPWGIWGDGTTMWVMGMDENIYSFFMPVSNNTLLRQLDFDLAGTPGDRFRARHRPTVAHGGGGRRDDIGHAHVRGAQPLRRCGGHPGRRQRHARRAPGQPDQRPGHDPPSRSPPSTARPAPTRS